MNKRYMDFVPVKRATIGGRATSDGAAAENDPVASSTALGATRGAASINGARRKVPTTPVRKAPTAQKPEATEIDDFALQEIFEEKEENAAKLGVIEDLGPRFVKTEVPKRPLSRAKKDTKAAEKTEEQAAIEVAEEELKNAKAEKLVGRSALTGKKLSAADGAMTRLNKRAGEKKAAEPETEVMDSATEAPQGAQGDSDTYKTPKFVNLEKVKKRPLSKNVYQKEIKTPVEEPKGPVTIIAKPEKESKVGMVIAVIITIILGATAGTVAFLLLPK